MSFKNYIKIGLCSALLLGAAVSASAQSALLEEGFEYAFPPQGWTVVDSQLPGAENHWDRVGYSVPAGYGSAHVTSPNYQQAEPVKEEILISPVVNLDGYYDLNFIWKGATAQSIGRAEPEYDFQVRVSEEGSDNWTTIFSFLDEDMVRSSGVEFLWTSWTNYPSSINLTDWSGKKVQFAFVYCLLKAGPGTGNDIWLDEVSVTPSRQITGPVAEISHESYIFPTAFIGGKKYSEIITLKNTGKDVLTVSGVSGLDGTDFGCTLVPAEVSLKTGDKYEFQFSYTPTMTGAASAMATIATNGGNVTVALSGSKRPVPADGAYEGFEDEVFPPLGWTKKGSGWYQFYAGLSGDKAAYCSFPDAESSLITPRLDLSGSDSQALQFTFFENYDPEDDDVGAANFFRVYLSTNGGTSWTRLFDSYNDMNPEGEPYALNEQHSVTIELPANSGDNCFIRFTSEIPGFSMATFDDVPDYTSIFLDDVILPTLYGKNGAPQSSTPVSPKDGETNVYHKNLTLEWTGALFATNYKLYLGKSATQFDVLNGVDMGTTTSYTVPRLDYATTYYWKVVGYNGEVANTQAPVWSFTVLADQSVTELPYSENFDEGFSLGWNKTQEGSTRWDLSNVAAYGGKGHSAYASGYQEGTTAILETPEILIPASGETLVSFVWGNAAPVGLTIDATGTKVNTTTSPGKLCTIFFDIEVDGVWKNLGLLHEEGETKYWYRESYPLQEYAGKNVAFRWRYEVYNNMAAAASVDNFLVETASDDVAMVKFNMEEWDAGYVNYGEKVTSRNPILLSNIGLSDLKVRSVNFTNPAFTSDLAAGTDVAANRSVAFAVTFNTDGGVTLAENSDEMVVTFENGTSASFPVKANALAADVFYYDFERDAHTSTQPKDFTTVDRDGFATVQPVMIYYEKRGAPFAYIVLNCTANYADWRNVYPVSGEQVLASMSESTGMYGTDDWIISPQLEATANSNFRFYAKSYGDESQVFSQGYIEVLVSNTGKEIANFETVLSSQKIPWSGNEGKWTEYNVDLSKYDGERIYVAVRHQTDKDGFVSFFDDFWFEHFSYRESGVEGVETAPAGKVELFDLNGLRVDPATALPGIYIKVVDGKASKTVIK